MLSIIIWIIVIIVIVKAIKRLISNGESQLNNSQPEYDCYTDDNHSQAAYPVSQRFYCPSCGAKLEGNARFCSSCGARLDASPDNRALTNVFIKGEALSTGRKILNLTSSSNLIDTFKYSNGIITIRTQSANTLSGPLKNLSVYFDYSADTQLKCITVKYNGNRLKIAAVPEIISDKNYDAIFAILSQAGSVSGLNNITEESIDRADRINNNITNFWQGYWMSQNMNRWNRNHRI